MGGNVIVTDIRGESTPAQKIPLHEIGRAQFCSDFRLLLMVINNLHDVFSGVPIWDQPMDILKDGTVFNGSAATLFDPSIPDEEYIKVKPLAGDIDVVLPEKYKLTVWKMLKTLQDKFVTFSFTYIGDNRPEFSERNDQINSLFRYTANGKTYNVQVDFEFLEYVNDVPSEFSKFSHSSDWNDMQLGIKGVNHKYLLRAMAGGASVMKDVAIMTPKATPDKPRVKKMAHDPHMLRFSLRGLRLGYKPQVEADGSAWLHNGLPVYKEIPTSDSHYETRLFMIFNYLFDDVAKDGELEQMNSFIGLVELMKKYHTKDQIMNTFYRLVDIYWGAGAQALERNHPVGDRAIKTQAYDYFLDAFPWIEEEGKNIFVQDIKDAFYDNYRVTEVEL